MILAGVLGAPKEAIAALRAWAELDEPDPLTPAQARAEFLHRDRYFYRRQTPPPDLAWSGPDPALIAPWLATRPSPNGNGHG